MKTAKYFAKGLLLLPIRIRLQIGHWLFGIEYVNAYLLRTTKHVQEILTQFGASIGSNCIIHGPLTIHNAKQNYHHLTIEKGVHLGREVFLDLTAPIYIKESAVVSMRSVLLTHQDIGARPLSKVFPRSISSLTIGTGAYIGANTKLLCDASIGDFTVVGAGSVVIKTLGSYCIAAGIPAEVKKVISPDELD